MLLVTLCTVAGDGPAADDWRAIAADGVAQAHRLARRLPPPAAARWWAALPAVDFPGARRIPWPRCAEMHADVAELLLRGGSRTVAGGVTLTATVYHVTV